MRAPEALPSRRGDVAAKAHSSEDIGHTRERRDGPRVGGQVTRSVRVTDSARSATRVISPAPHSRRTHTLRYGLAFPRVVSGTSSGQGSEKTEARKQTT